MNINVAAEKAGVEIGAAPFEVERLGAKLGAEIHGLDLKERMDPKTFTAFEAALIEHKVIVVRDQHLTTEQHVEISRMFGELEVHPMRPQGEFPEILVLDNHKDNPVLSTDVWHSDTTFRKNPTKYTILRCQIMPKVGGDTLWANMEAVYEELSDTLQDNDRRIFARCTTSRTSACCSRRRTRTRPSCARWRSSFPIPRIRSCARIRSPEGNAST